MTRRLRLLSVIPVVVALGCAGGGGPAARRQGESPFPSPAELDRLDRPPAAPFADLRYDDVESWTLEGPFPETAGVAAYESSAPADALLASAVARRAGLAVASEAMHCAAREIARFVAQRGASPPPSLVEYMAARCGAVGAEARTLWYAGDLPARVADEELIAGWRPQIEDLVQKSMAGGAVDVGIATAREPHRAAVVVLSAVRRVHVEPFAPVPSNGRVAFGGDVLHDAEQLSAWVNLGRLGYAECDLAPDVRLPRFAVSCPLASGDATAAIDVMVRERGRVLGEGAMHVLARRSASDGLTWKRARHAPERIASSPAEFAAAVGDALGAVRERAGLPALTLSAAQSREMDELVPHLLAPSVGAGSPALADLATLGIVAGWKVGGTIRDAGLAGAVLTGPLDAGRWVDAALERPAARASLLDPEARVLAVGTLSAEGAPVLAAVAATYQLFGEQDFQRDAERYLERVASARAAQGRSAPQTVKGLGPLLEAAVADIPKRGLAPKAALEEAMARAVTQLGRPVRGYWIESMRADELPVPDELTGPDDLRMAVAVGYYQPSDMPWGRIVALVLFESPEVGI